MLRKWLLFAMLVLKMSLEAFPCPPPNFTISSPVASNAQVAIVDVGNAVAVWQQNGAIFASILIKGESWSTPQQIAPSGINPKIAINTITGIAVAVWTKPGAPSVAQSAILTTSWSAPIDIAPSSNSQSTVSVAMNTSNVAVATWWEELVPGDFKPRSANIQAHDETSWSNVQDITVDFADTDTINSNVAIDDSGNAVAVFDVLDDFGDSDVYAFTLHGGGSSWSGGLISTDPFSDKSQVAMNSTGYAVAVWHVGSAPDVIQATTMQFGNPWSTVDTISTPGFNADEPAVAVDLHGDAIAVWQQDLGGPDLVVQSSFLPSGGGWQPPVNISSAGVDTVDDPRVKFDSNGAAYATWTRTSNSIIQAATSPSSGTGWSTPCDISPLAESSNTPQIAVDPSGYAVVVWTRVVVNVIKAAILVPPPTVTDVNPNSGPTTGGNTVFIDGTNFVDVTAVQFGGTNATSFVVNSASSITAIAPAHAAGTVNVTVTTLSGTSPVTSADDYTFIAGPTVTSVNPNFGPTTGGNSVTITGTNFVNVTAVQFGGTNAASFVVNSSTQITAIAPAHVEGTVDVRVTTSAGTSPITPNDRYTFLSQPTVTNVNPNFGPTAGGNSVTITGSGFTNVTAVTFGTTNATSFTVNSSTSITAIAPTHAQGTVDVTVTTVEGTSHTSPADQYTFQNVPTVTNVNPNFGAVEGGNSVVITGTGFLNVTAVQFGTTNATSFVVNSTTSITAVAPPHALGTVDVRVTTFAGTSPITPADQYTYLAIPTVTNVNPNFGPTAGGTTVIITGTAFIDVTEVQFGTTAATSFVVNSDTQITAVSPPHAEGTVDVRVTTLEGTSHPTPDDQFTFQDQPTITNVNPNFGSTEGGNFVTITGTGFFNVTAVRFGSTNADSFVVNSSTSITAIAPEHDLGTVDVRVTTFAGVSPITPADQYTFLTLPTVTNVNPNVGPTSAGNTVVITGTGFIDVTAVQFGTTNATSFVVNSSTQITAIAPPHAAGTVDVKVTTLDGTSHIAPEDQYTFQNAPTVTNVNPNRGPTTGGNIVTITGTGFLNVTGVQFGTTSATSFIVHTPTLITVIAPAHAAGTVDVRVLTAGGISPITPNDRYTFINAPFPPSNFTGVIIKNKFLNTTECSLKATWSPSPSVGVVLYRIYRGTRVVAEISATSPLVFTTCLTDCNAQGFSITAVNAQNEESIHVTLIVINNLGK